MGWYKLSISMPDLAKPAKKWFIIVVRSIPYRKAAGILEKLGYTFYMPIQRQLRIWSDRKRWTDVPVLAPYIFIYTSESERRLLFESSSSFQFLTMNGRLAVAREGEIENVKKLCAYQSRVSLTSSHIQHGDEVTITEGPFAGLTGFAFQENGRHRFLIRIASLGKFASVELEASCLQPVH